MIYNKDFTQEFLKTILSYDPETGIFNWIVRRGRQKAGSVAGSKRADGYVIIRICGRTCLAHRLAHLYMTGEWPPFDVDHECRDPSDNRWSEIRAATKSQNQQNRTVQNNNRLGVKGVKILPSGKYMARIGGHSNFKYLGTFDTPELASAAYAKAANDNFGEFARTA